MSAGAVDGRIEAGPPRPVAGGGLEWARDGYVVSTVRARLDLVTLHAVLARTYWNHGVSPAHLRRAIEHSLPLGLYAPDGTTAGFARIVTDKATFAWLADVFVLEAHRGRGLGRFLAACAIAHPEVATVRNFLLATRDAHAVYRAVGFEPLDPPQRWMRRRGAGYGPGLGLGEPHEGPPAGE